MSNKHQRTENPFSPGAGHRPPYLAGRKKEEREFKKLLEQSKILDNLVLTGLRGVGKTVLLDTLKPIALEENWLWVGNDLSESASVTEENLATRIITDLAAVTSTIEYTSYTKYDIGFAKNKKSITLTLDYSLLLTIYEQTPGLVSDKLKAVLLAAWEGIKDTKKKGVVFAYDEAQNLADHKSKNQYPLSILLEVFQSVQKMEIPFMLVLTGLPTLSTKLVEVRTYSERMFKVITLKKLTPKDSREAIVKPTELIDIKFTESAIQDISKKSGGYPYFIQFICREAFDLYIAGSSNNNKKPPINIDSIIKKLDSSFFSGRWNKATDRQRELLKVIAKLPNCELEFTVQEISEKSKQLGDSFGTSHINQMLSVLCNAGLIYKNRHGKYSLAVPLFHEFISRQ